MTVAAICAVCEQPITKAQRFVLSATEVIHRSCASTGAKTVLWRTLEDRARAVAAAERGLRVSDQDLKRVEDRVQALMRELELVKREWTRQSSERDAALMANSALRVQRDDMQAQRDRATAERDAALRQISAARTTPSSQPGSNTSSDPVDDAVARFALLELT